MIAGVTEELASFIAASTYASLPAAIRHDGVRALVNWVGCAVGGSQTEVVEHALGVFSEFNGTGKHTLAGRSEKLDALNATYINALSSTVLMFNDTHAATVAHPTGPVAAALFALAERQPLIGSDFLNALIVGIEVQCRVGNMLCVPPAECSGGLSMGGLVGGIGAAAAAARVLALNAVQTAAALGLAANHAAGLRQAHASMANSLTPAHAARCGLTAAMMAARGVTCSGDMLEGPKGFAVSYGQNPNFAAALDGLGTTFETSALSYKPYPSGFVSHPVIDSCLDLVRREAFDVSDVERIDLTVNPLVLRLMDRPAPSSTAEAMMSVQHWAAVALSCHAAGIAQTTAAVANLPQVLALRRKVELKPDPAIGSDGTVLRLRLRTGRQFEVIVAHCRGSAERPMSDDDISEKACGQLLGAFAEAEAGGIVAESWRIGESIDVGAFCRKLGVPLDHPQD